MNPIKVFISHDGRDAEIASVLGRALGRITLGQIETWYSSDGSAGGGIRPGSVWLDDIRRQLQESRVLVALLTPRSLSRPWLLFEAGFAAANQNCEVIPVAAGVDSLGAVPFPLGMYQVFQISDYESLKRFAAKLLTRYEIPFDEEMVQPVLQSSVGEFARLATMQPAVAESLDSKYSGEIIDAVKQHIDRALLRLTEASDLNVARRVLSEEVYSVEIDVPTHELTDTQFVTIGMDTTVQDVLDRVYFMLRPEMPPFKYLEKWLLREKGTGFNLIVREISMRIPASGVFPPGSKWEVLKLTKPYSPSDSKDHTRWYRQR